MRLALLLSAALALAGACKNPANKTYTCASDRDCKVSCEIKDDCCGQGCACTNVYHTDELDVIRAANEARCKREDFDQCPDYKCSRSEVDYTARCNAGTCELERTPITDASP